MALRSNEVNEAPRWCFCLCFVRQTSILLCKYLAIVSCHDNTDSSVRHQQLAIWIMGAKKRRARVIFNEITSNWGLKECINIIESATSN